MRRLAILFLALASGLPLHLISVASGLLLSLFALVASGTAKLFFALATRFFFALDSVCPFSLLCPQLRFNTALLCSCHRPGITFLIFASGLALHLIAFASGSAILLFAIASSLLLSLLLLSSSSAWLFFAVATPQVCRYSSMPLPQD
jgi:hypothetical protein